MVSGWPCTKYTTSICMAIPWLNVIANERAFSVLVFNEAQILQSVFYSEKLHVRGTE